jgi:hypothetical protein
MGVRGLPMPFWRGCRPTVPPAPANDGRRRKKLLGRELHVTFTARTRRTGEARPDGRRIALNS